MGEAAPAPAAVGRLKLSFSKVLRRLLVVPEARFPLAVEPAPPRDLPAPEMLSIFLGRTEIRGPRLSPSVAKGDEVVAGQPLASLGKAPIAPSPFAGQVVAVRPAPDVRGGKPGLAAVLAPSETDATAFEPLDVDGSPTFLLGRIRDARIPIEFPPAGVPLVVLAADQEPGLSSALHLLLEDPVAAVRATRLLARLSGASRAVLAVAKPHESAVCAAADEAGVEVLLLAPDYPATLPPVVARRVAPAGPPPPIVPLASALLALAAVERGEVPAARVLTVLGPDGAPIANYRVALGTTVGEVLAAAGLSPGPGDKIVTGGPFRGLAQYSLDAAVDATVEGLMLVRAGTFSAWSDEPCVNCGSCLDVCPEHLQAHHLARYAEFGLFDRASEHDLDDCIECGLCASVCPARRPLLQYIRLAKREVAAVAASDALVAAAAGRGPAGREPDPIPVAVATAKKD